MDTPSRHCHWRKPSHWRSGYQLRRSVPGSVRRKRRIVAFDKIRWVAAEGYYAGLHTQDGEYLIRESLAKLSQTLDQARFVRVHRSTIVNLEFVDSYVPDSSGNWIIRMSDGTQRPVSRRGRQLLESRLTDVRAGANPASGLTRS